MKFFRFIIVLSAFIFCADYASATTVDEPDLTNDSKDQAKVQTQDNSGKYNFTLFNFFYNQLKSTGDSTETEQGLDENLNAKDSKPIL